MRNSARILIVDDDDLFRRALARRLRSKVTLFVAASADEARAMIAAEELDAVVTDYDLGTAETGLDLLRGLLRSQPQVRRILMTGGLPQGLHPEEGLCEAMLEKPFDARVLIDLLDSEA
ncbi:MAG: response regulator [Polyangiaceae bacterium]|nr:response regulator [Polyangiaceae bacterium]MBK8940644.1 response regulator [Polyangiaceae bacterium]